MGEDTKGKLYVCATPIGNLEDVSLRLLRILSEVDVIACEDTRVTRGLLSRYHISKPTVSYYQHNEKSRGEELIKKMKEGLKVALVSDAGTPGISDPGHQLILRAIQEQIEIEAVPGPSALITALVLSGMNADRFVFEGFLPSRGEGRRQRLAFLAREERTVVMYEAPHRLLRLLEEIEEVMGDRELAVVREMTKVHQEVRRGKVSEIRNYFEKNQPKGEITLVVAGRISEEEEKDLEAIAKEVLALEQEGVEKKKAFEMKAREYGVKKRDLYNKIVELKNPNTAM